MTAATVTPAAISGINTSLGSRFCGRIFAIPTDATATTTVCSK